jgi:hypothetical protein
MVSAFKLCSFCSYRVCNFREFKNLDITYIKLALSDPCSTDHGNLPDRYTPNSVAKVETDDGPPDDPANIIFSK